jgi:hypothetical protein
MVSATPHGGGCGIIKTWFLKATQCGFSQHFQRHNAPDCNTLLLLVLTWCQEGSVKDSKPHGCPCSVRTPDNVEWVRHTILQSPHRSAWQQSLALHLNNSSGCQIHHKDLHYFLYKIHVAQELGEQDKMSQLQLCSEFLDLVKSNHITDVR